MSERVYYETKNLLQAHVKKLYEVMISYLKFNVNLFCF